MINCTHWKDCGITSDGVTVGGCCQAGHYKGKPSLGVCGVCEHREPQAVTVSSRPGVLQQAATAFQSGTKAALSVAKTTVGIDRLPEDQVEARLAICRQCPSGHARFDKNGDLFTCGSMLDELRKVNPESKACGCLLNKKARDATQSCPEGYW